MPPRLSFKRFACYCIRGGAWALHNSGYTQKLSLSEMQENSQGRTLPDQQYVQCMINILNVTGMKSRLQALNFSAALH